MDFNFIKLFFIIGMVIVSIGVVLYNMCKSVYTWSDHYGWEENSSPDKNAKIKNITSKEVQYSRNGAKLKTTITFSDGFYFISYKTDREDKALTYKIYLSNELREKIIGSAIEQHKMSVDSFVNDNYSEDQNTHYVSIKDKKDIKQIKIAIINDNKYIDFKSDDRIEYLKNLKKQTESELDKLNKAIKIESGKIRNIPADIAKYVKTTDILSLRDNIQKLGNKKLALEELIALEINDKLQKKEYEVLAHKLTTKTKSNKKPFVADSKKEDRSQKEYGWQSWD